MASSEWRKKEAGKERGREGRGRRLLVTHGHSDDSWHNLTSSEARQHQYPALSAQLCGVVGLQTPPSVPTMRR